MTKKKVIFAFFVFFFAKNIGNINILAISI